MSAKFITIKLQKYCFLPEFSGLWFGSPTPTYSTAARWVKDEGVQRTYHKEDFRFCTCHLNDISEFTLDLDVNVIFKYFGCIFKILT